MFRPGTASPASVAPYFGGDDEGKRRRSPEKSEPRRGRLRRTLSLSCAEGMAGELVASTAGGAVLTGWALYLGCNPVILALLGALPFLAQVVQFPSAWLTSSVGSRRVAISGLGLGRLVLAPLVALPFLPVGNGAKQALLLLVATISNLLLVMGTNAWMAWMGDLVPEKLRGRYFGKRLSLVTVAGAAGALSAGLWLDVSKRSGTEPTALAALAGIACLAGATTVILLLRHQVPEARDEGKKGFDFGAAAEALRDPRSRPFLRYQLAWNAAIGVAASFFAVHMLQNLKMGFALMAAHGVAVAAVRVLVSPLWGKLIDRFGARPVLILCSWGIGVVPLVWLFPTANSLFWPLATDVVLAGSLWAGHALASFELPLAVAPREKRPYYLAGFATAGGIAFAAASAVGGFLAQGLPKHVILFGHSMHAFHVLFVISSLGRFLSAPLSLRIEEPGASPMEELWRGLGARIELRREQVSRVFARVVE